MCIDKLNNGHRAKKKKENFRYYGNVMRQLIEHEPVKDLARRKTGEGRRSHFAFERTRRMEI
jgi:hypothetical protein